MATNQLQSYIRDVLDFPEPGIVYKDITPLLANAKAFKSVIKSLSERYQPQPIDFIAGVESRGFIFGSALAAELSVGFTPIRKKGKLPFTVISEDYKLEYGVNTIEMHQDAFLSVQDPNVLLIDDVLATGGTARAAANLIQAGGGQLLEACFIIELAALEGKQKLEGLVSTYSLLTV